MPRAAACFVVLVLLAACSDDRGTDGPSAAPTATTDAPTAEPYLGVETGLTLIVAPGYGPLFALDLDAGTARAYTATGGWPGDHPFKILRIGDGVAFPGSGTTRWLPLSLEGPSRSLGTSSYFVPSGRAGHLWLVDGITDEETTLREVDSEGETTMSPVVLPLDRFVEAGVAERLVVLAEPGRILVRDLFQPPPFIRRASTQFIAAGGSKVAWIAPCDGCVRLRILDVTSGVEQDVSLHRSPSNAAFSPDGQWLALWNGRQTTEVTGGLQLVDIGSGTVTTVPGSDGPGYVQLGWSPDSSWVFGLGQIADAPAELVAHHIGDDRAITRATPSLQGGSLVAVATGDGPDLSGEAPRCPSVGGRDHNTNPLPALTTDGPCRIR